MGLDDNSTAVLNTAIGVLAHKWADTLALSLILLKSKTKKVSMLCALPLQSFACPFGILLGLAVASNVSEGAVGFALCATAGFLTYFFASDIVPELFEGEGRMAKFAIMCAGIGLFTTTVTLGEYYRGD